MFDYNSMNNELGEYFRSLPDELKQSILSSGVVFHTKIDMARALSHFNENIN